jgi:hypothetical protein
MFIFRYKTSWAVVVGITALLSAFMVAQIGCGNNQRGKMSSANTLEDVGKSRSVLVGNLQRLSPGCSKDEFEKKAGTLGRHEISLLLDGEKVTVYSFYIINDYSEALSADSEMIWSIFVNDKFYKLSSYVRHGGMDGVVNLGRPTNNIKILQLRMETRVRRAISEPAYFLSVKRQEAHPVDLGLSTAFLVLGSNISGSVQRDLVANHAVQLKLSGDKIVIGEKQESVLKIVGPITGKTQDGVDANLEVIQYGEPASLNVAPQDAAHPLLVVYLKEKAIMSINHEFYLESVGY